MSFVSILAGVFSVLVVFAAVADDGIADVRTLDELQKVKPVALPGGGEIRLGLAESGPDGGPWKLLYGLVKSGRGENRIQRSHAELQPLGPVFFKVKSPRPGQSALSKAQSLVELAKKENPEGVMDLYCARVMTAFPGKYELAVQDAAGRVLQKKTFNVSRVRSAYWLELAGPDDKTLVQRPTECVPNFDGSQVIGQVSKEGLMFGMALFQFTELAKPGNRAPLANDLPGGIPLDDRLESVFDVVKHEPGHPPFRLLLGINGDELVVQSVAIDLESLEEEDSFLVRWWLNGQPVLPVRSGVAEQEKPVQKREIRERFQKKLDEHGTVTERRWRFVLPPIFKTLRVGDQIRMQVLYCPRGHMWFSDAADGSGAEAFLWSALSPYTPNVPVLSNPLELVVSDATVGKAKASVRPGQPKLQPLKVAAPEVEMPEETK